MSLSSSNVPRFTSWPLVRRMSSSVMAWSEKICVQMCQPEISQLRFFFVSNVELGHSWVRGVDARGLFALTRPDLLLDGR